jgi:ABC-type transport system involved in Fe-S cluster assembly fused permease/ATPase subunit
LFIIDCKQNLIDSEIKTIANNSQVSLLYESNQIGSGNGLTIDFKDVQVKLCGKKVLSIPHLHIEKFDIIGVTGNGSNLLSAVIFKLIKPVLGSITLEGNDLSILSQESLVKIISFVPNDLNVQCTIS